MEGRTPASWQRLPNASEVYWAALVAVMDDVTRRALTNGHFECIDRQFGAQVVRHGPAEDLAAPGMEDHGNPQRFPDCARQASTSSSSTARLASPRSCGRRSPSPIWCSCPHRPAHSGRIRRNSVASPPSPHQRVIPAAFTMSQHTAIAKPILQGPPSPSAIPLYWIARN